VAAPRPPIHVEVGDRVIPDDGLVHVVGWTNHRSWDAVCENIVEDYQPDYYQALLDVDDAQLDKESALRLQRASDDAPITCVLCLRAQWRLNEPEDDTEEDAWPE
jgi:hypothetical protein